MVTERPSARSMVREVLVEVEAVMRWNLLRKS
jgi:hypothetical protein